MIYGFSNFGYEGSMVTVEVDLRRGIPMVDIVGVSDVAMSELRARVVSAIKNSGFEFPSERVLISLSPADLKKDGFQFDLTVALAILEAQYNSAIERLGSVDTRFTESVYVAGELTLDGNVKRVLGLHAGLATASSYGIKWALVPKDSGRSIPSGIKVIYVDNLRQAWDVLLKIKNNPDDVVYYESNEPDKANNEVKFATEETTLDTLNVLPELKFAMAVASAGRHNIMAVGSPYAQKTEVMKRLPEITPCLLPEERASVTRIFSIAGLSELNSSTGYASVRPFRMPHQTASIEGICGGGINCRPGEISLAHNGTLFLDEAAEFRASVLQMLRVPIENHTIALSRAGRTTVYPAHFQLAMTVSPCPCGNYGSHTKICLCSMKSVEQYWKKFSAPLLDRIDIRFNCFENEQDEEDVVTEKNKAMTVEKLRNMVKIAWEKQLARQGKLNADLTPTEVSTYCAFSEDIQSYFETQALKYDLSPRAKTSIKKVARTLADMSGSDEICLDDVKQAIKMRAPMPLERGYDFQP